MIQFNLLPDVKLEFVKARRVKRLATTVSVIASIASIAILIVLLLIVDGLQKKQISDANHNIATYTSQINSDPNLNKILTIQNQIQTLPTLDAQKPAIGRLFNYLTQLIPNTTSLGTLTLDLTTNTLDVSGTAPDLSTVDQFVDTLKFTTYKIGNTSPTPNVFSNVVLSSFGIETPPQTGVSFTINTSFAPTIFNATDNITLSVPSIISTRSETQQPSDLFAKPVAIIKYNTSQ